MRNHVDGDGVVELDRWLGLTLDVTLPAYDVRMEDKDLRDDTPTARSKIRIIKSDDELTPAALAALHRRSDEELRRLAGRAISRG